MSTSFQSSSTSILQFYPPSSSTFEDTIDSASDLIPHSTASTFPPAIPSPTLLPCIRLHKIRPYGPFLSQHPLDTIGPHETSCQQPKTMGATLEDGWHDGNQDVGITNVSMKERIRRYAASLVSKYRPLTCRMHAQLSSFLTHCSIASLLIPYFYHYHSAHIPLTLSRYATPIPAMTSDLSVDISCPHPTSSIPAHLDLDRLVIHLVQSSLEVMLDTRDGIDRRKPIR